MIFYRRSMPQVDLHGMDREIARITVHDFLMDQWKMGVRECAIIHGIGTGILCKEVHRVLKYEKIVEEFKLDNFNNGCTLVRLKEKS